MVDRGALRRPFVVGLLIIGMAGASVACVSGAPPFEIASGGRLSLGPSDVEERTRVVFLLEIEDEGIAPTRTTRVVSLDGRRLDTRVERVAGRESSFRLDLDRAFLRPGGYLIEVDAEGTRALNVRRFVIEVKETDASTPAR